eukprot:TRINITY_DN999_c0_g1_i11.p2 TRINITY_DN999_c0_g1~~TRINITY_DN999_c0_g1_i11.p2  ORF type:complete len:511 (-),score=83.49 TRINITY_DN999_c0_g1_i11:855-2387(-)
MGINLKWILFVFTISFLHVNTKEVVDLKDKTFNEFLESHDVTLVTFYSKQCPHCQAFEPLFEAAAVEAKSLGRPYSFARIEVNEEYIASDQNKIEFLPTIRLFIKGTSVKPDYDRESTSVLQFVDSHVKEVYHLLKLESPEEIRSKANTVAPQLILVSDNEMEIEIFRQVAAEFPELNFYYISREVGGKVFPDLKEFPAIVLFKGFDEKKAVYIGKMHKDDIKEFVEDNKHPRVREFDHETVGKIFKAGGMKATILFYKLGTQTQGILDEFHTVATNKKAKDMYFIASDPGTGLGQKVAKIIGIEEEETPIILILERKQQMIAYPFNGEFKAGEIAKFVDQWREGKVPKMGKSESIPKGNTGPVKKIVGKTFKKEVMEYEGDVLVNFCIPSIEKCRNFQEVYNKVADMVKEWVKVATIDPAKNEIEEIEVGNKYPVLQLFLKGNKKNPKIYEGKLTEKDILEFIKKYKTVKSATRVDLQFIDRLSSLTHTKHPLSEFMNPFKNINNSKAC